jgi:iron-sulfur cluster repair protein YtfE (RIC family)
MTAIRDFLTTDHRRCDDFFAELEQAVSAGSSASAKAALQQFRQAMLAHFSAEEETLFPAFEAKTGMSTGPTQVMRGEHEQMRGLMNDAVDALARDDSEQCLGIADTLLIMMQQHNMKEENILYPMCDQHLAGNASTLLQRLEAQLFAI